MGRNRSPTRTGGLAACCTPSSRLAAKAEAEAGKGSLPRLSPDAPASSQAPQQLATPHRRDGNVPNAQQPASR